MTSTPQEGTEANGLNNDGALDQTFATNAEGEMAGGSLDSSTVKIGPVDASSENCISIAVDPVALITTECITVTSAMRKHARWAQSSVSAILGGGGALNSGRGSSNLPKHMRGSSTHQRGSSQNGKISNDLLTVQDGLTGRWGLRGKKGKSIQDNPLMSAFARLRSDLRGCTSEHTSRSSTIMEPDIL